MSSAAATAATAATAVVAPTLEKDPVACPTGPEIIHYSSNGWDCDICCAVLVGIKARPHPRGFSVVMIESDPNSTWISTRKPTCDRI